MSIIQSIILGAVQGFTEFLPISSSGHLVLFQKTFHINEQALFFDVMLHFGTVIPLFIIFRKEIKEITTDPFHNRLLGYLIIGTLPAVVIGFLFKDIFEKLFASGASVGIEFLITAVILWLIERKKSGTRLLDKMKPRDSLVIGFTQALAIFPAISRSGITISGALFQGLDRKFAAKFSFLLAIPSILGASVIELKDVSVTTMSGNLLLPVFLGMITAAVVGYIAIRWMLIIIEKKTMKPFAVYVGVLGVSIVILQLAGKW